MNTSKPTVVEDFISLNRAASPYKDEKASASDYLTRLEAKRHSRPTSPDSCFGHFDTLLKQKETTVTLNQSSRYAISRYPTGFKVSQPGEMSYNQLQRPISSYSRPRTAGGRKTVPARKKQERARTALTSPIDELLTVGCSK